MATTGGQSGTPVGGGTPLSSIIYSKEHSNIFPLESWRRSIGYHPWHFWGLADDGLLKLSSKCNRVVPQYAWQASDMPSREAVRLAIISAENLLRQHLRFSVGTRFIDETVSYPRPKDYGKQFSAPIGSDGRWLSVQATENYVKKAGIEAVEMIQAGATVAYSDEDSDDYNDTFTLTAPTTVTDPDQIAVYFAAGDRLDGDPVSEKYRISPIKVTINSGTLTIKGPAWCCVRPIRYEGLNPVGIDPSSSDVFATTLDIARRYCDPTGTTIDDCQAVMIWETTPFPSWACACNGTLTYADGSRDPAALAYAVARVQIREERYGHLTAGHAIYDETNEQWVAKQWGSYRQPDRIRLRYQCGVPIDALSSTTGLPFTQGNWDTTVARLTCAEIPQRQWACDDANSEIYRWQFDRARAQGANDEQYRISDEELNNPFGTAAGAIYAWRQVKNLAVSRAVVF